MFFFSQILIPFQIPYCKGEEALAEKKQQSGKTKSTFAKRRPSRNLLSPHQQPTPFPSTESPFQQEIRRGLTSKAGKTRTRQNIKVFHSPGARWENGNLDVAKSVLIT